MQVTMQRAAITLLVFIFLLIAQTTNSVTESSGISYGKDGRRHRLGLDSVGTRLLGGGEGYNRKYYKNYNGDYNNYNRTKYNSNGYHSYNNQNDAIRRRRKHKVYSTLSDVWLCLACALGWTVWILSSTRPEHAEMLRYQNESSKKVFGHVLQATVGQDADGTGIPVYHAVIDYVVQFSDHPVQVRKCFQTRHLLQEGFANIELLVLAEDPTMSVLLDDYLADVHDRRRKHYPGGGGEHSFWITLCTYLLGLLLIGTSIVGAGRAVMRLKPEYYQWGWISFGVGLVLLYPMASCIHTAATYCYRCLGPVSSRPGTIIHGTPSNIIHTRNMSEHSNPSRSGSSGIVVGGSTSNPFVEVFEDEVLADVETFDLSTALGSPSVSSHAQPPGATPRMSNLSNAIPYAVSNALGINQSHDMPIHEGSDYEMSRRHNGTVKKDAKNDGRGLARYFHSPQLQRVFSGDRVMCIATNRAPTYDESDANKNDNNTAGGRGGGHYNQNATNGQYSISLPDANSNSCSSVSSISMQSNLPHGQESVAGSSISTVPAYNPA